MRTFDIRRIRSGVEDDFAWVTLWFKGEGRTLELLHLVCQREAQGGKYAKYDTLYLERNDQSIACYGGADQVVVNERGMKIVLNQTGVKSLGLDPSFVLAVPEELSGWIKACRVFREMAGYPTGQVIKLSKSLAPAKPQQS